MMEFRRHSVIALYLTGRPQVAIVEALRHLNVNKSFVSRTIARYRDTGSVASRPKSGRKKTVTTPEMIRKVKDRFERNPRDSDRKIARELNISRERLQHILKNELGLMPLKFEKVHELTDRPQNRKYDVEDDVQPGEEEEDHEDVSIKEENLIQSKTEEPVSENKSNKKQTDDKPSASEVRKHKPRKTD